MCMRTHAHVCVLTCMYVCMCVCLCWRLQIIHLLSRAVASSGSCCSCIWPWPPSSPSSWSSSSLCADWSACQHSTPDLVTDSVTGQRNILTYFGQTTKVNTWPFSVAWLEWSRWNLSWVHFLDSQLVSTTPVTYLIHLRMVKATSDTILCKLVD